MTSHHTHRRPALLLRLALCLAPITLMPAAQAQQHQSVQRYDIAAGPLSTALGQFAARAGILLSGDAALTTGKHTAGLRGDYSVRQGLATLLAGSGLIVEESDHGRYVLRRTTATLAPVDINAATTSAAGPAVVDDVWISRRQASDLGDVFSATPEVAVGGSLAAAEKLYVRGIEDPMLNISIDGATQAGRLFHHTGRVGIEPELLKRVEVDGGPGAATAGAGALGGAIRFVTRDPEDLLKPGQRVGGLLKTQYYSNSEGHKVSGTLYGRFTDQWSAMASMTLTDQDEFRDGNGDRLTGTAARQEVGFAKLVGHIGDSQTLRLSYDRREDKGTRTQRPQWVVSGFNKLYSLQSLRETVTLNYHLNPIDNEALALETTLYHTDAELEQNVVDRWGRYQGHAKSVGGDLRNTSRFLNHTLTYGADYRRDTVNAGAAVTPNAEEDKAEVLGVYVQDSIRLTDRWTLGAGVRFDHYERDDNTGQKFDEDGVSPNAELRYQFNTPLMLFARYAEAFRGPLPPDSFKIDAATNAPDLKPEQARNHELGFEYVQAAWSLSGKIYRTDIDDVIADPVGSPTLYDNIGDLESKGYLISLARQWQRLEAQLSFHHNRAEIDGRRLNAYDHGGIGNSIGDTVIATLNYAVTERLDIGWNGHFVRGLRDLRTNPGEIDKPGYGVSDVFAEWRPAALPEMTLTLTAKNIFDKQYLDHASNASFEHIAGYEGVIGLPEPGRDIRLGMTLQF